MNWTDKAILVQALNQGEYERAVTMMREHETDMDKQAVMMFVNGFSINETHLLHSIADILMKYENVCFDDFRTDIRFGMMLERIKE